MSKPNLDLVERLSRENAVMKSALEFISCEGMDDGDFYVEQENADCAAGAIRMANCARDALASLGETK